MDKIGSFKVESNKLMVTDPCYERGTWCQGIIDNVVPGTWFAYLDQQNFGKGIFGGSRVKQILVKHEACLTSIKNYANWQPQKFEVGVDSGQAGIFDESKYPEGETGEFGEINTFYGQVCELTLGNVNPGQYGGVVDFGAVSSSGYGDGGYTAYSLLSEEGKVVAVKIVFIEEEEELVT